MYDALYEMMGFDRVARFIERNVIEVAPLAFMRGRSLNDSFIILDEAQNTTIEQMKMFLTRIGFGSEAVVTGDVTQTDLPRGHAVGPAARASTCCAGSQGVAFTFFDAQDVVRHPLVQRIVQAYESHERLVSHEHAPRRGAASLQLRCAACGWAPAARELRALGERRARARAPPGASSRCAGRAGARAGASMRATAAATTPPTCCPFPAPPSAARARCAARATW